MSLGWVCGTLIASYDPTTKRRSGLGVTQIGRDRSTQAALGGAYRPLDSQSWRVREKTAQIPRDTGKRRAWMTW
jgi:hypothetical protein